ncbi:MAG: hypothetical protein OES13_05710 [Acidimicrobiia bacterium]|nr:hypothetical protein [Acidimicrobiia bacterium]
MREWSDEEVAPEIELLEMRLQQQRRKRIIAGIAVVVIVAMVGLLAFSDIWRANRHRVPAPEKIEFVET